jgi:hypothetical protein
MGRESSVRRIAKARRLAAPLLVLPLLVAGAASARAQDMGSNSGGLSRRVQYDIEYLSTGSGAAMRRSHLLILLTRGQVDTLQPAVDSAVTAQEKHDADQAGINTRHNSVAVPCGGHWYAEVYAADSVWVLGQALRRPGGDTAFVVMVDRADHVGGDPVVAGVAAITTRMPGRFWTLDTDPIRQTRILAGWLRMQKAVREFLQ